MEGSSKFVLKVDGFRDLLNNLRKNGYQTIGPKLKDEAIVYDFIDGFEDLPVGYSDLQNNGYYRVHKEDDRSLFSNYTVGQNSIKQFIFPAYKTILKIKNENSSFQIESNSDKIPKFAFIGIRPCELAALKIQDKILTQGKYIDNDYLQIRQNMLIIAVNCSNPGNTCFCESMKTGPFASDGFDLALSEIQNQNGNYLIIEAGSDKGTEIISAIKTSQPTDKQLSAERNLLEEAVLKFSRKLSIDNLKDLLFNQFDNPYWDEISKRCLTCGNCTMVCPTCFCNNIEDQTDLSGKNAERFRKWDSCFNNDFTYIHGGSIRSSAKSRYRQWHLHKLSYWHDQFETSGCVGCGRCITWCPVGIDITEVASRICLKT